MTKRYIDTITIAHAPATSSYDVFAGANDSDIEQLVDSKSVEPHILRYTPNDHAGRFASTTSFDAWSRKGRAPYTLNDPASGDLGGLIWYGPQAFPIEAYAAA